MSRFLVTGVGGFVGPHLVRELHAQGHEIIGLSHGSNVTQTVRDMLSDYFTCDLSKPTEVEKLPLSNIDAVINLAGLANVGRSFTEPEIYKHINVAVLEVLGNRLLEIGSSARVIAVSTGAVYRAEQPLPLTEASKTIKSGSPYALSKLLMEETAHKLRTDGLDCIVVRPFNHIGPGQGRGFLVPDLYQKCVEAIRTTSPVKVGNLSTLRDYTDVRDVVRAYVELSLADASTLTSAVYNVCSAVSRSGEEILHELEKYIPGAAGLETVTDPALTRPNDPKELVGSNDLIQSDIGWRPTIPLHQTIKDFVGSL